MARQCVRCMPILLLLCDKQSKAFFKGINPWGRTGHITQERYPPRAHSFLRRLNKKQTARERWRAGQRKVLGCWLCRWVLFALIAKPYTLLQGHVLLVKAPRQQTFQACKCHRPLSRVSAAPPTFHTNLPNPTRSHCGSLQRTRFDNRPRGPPIILVKKHVSHTHKYISLTPAQSYSSRSVLRRCKERSPV